MEHKVKQKGKNENLLQMEARVIDIKQFHVLLSQIKQCDSFLRLLLLQL